MDGSRIITAGGEEWPEQLNELPDPPRQLYLIGAGNLRMLSMRSVAIVGARACTSYGEFVATDLAAALAEKGLTVISGGAYGIDAAAHRGALAAGRPTVLVSPGALDKPYPAGNQALWPRVLEEGVIVSEYPPGTIVNRSRFLARNRIVAALSPGVVVIEAGLRSGTMNTVGHATNLRRAVMATPGPLTSVVSAGCHELIHSGQAKLVRDSSDVLTYLDLATFARNHRSKEVSHDVRGRG